MTDAIDTLCREHLAAVADEYAVDPHRIRGEDRTGRASEARKALIWRLHTADVPHVAIADWINRSVSYVNVAVKYKVLREGLRDDRNPFEQAYERRKEVLSLIDKGVPLHEVAARTGYTYGSLRSVLSRMRKRGEVHYLYNHNKEAKL
jgi:hypothetical protein